jgi:hypothetical protein
MAELTINTLIKIVLGVAVIAVVATALYLFFKNYVLGFFEGVGGNETVKCFLSLG